MSHKGETEIPRWLAWDSRAQACSSKFGLQTESHPHTHFERIPWKGRLRKISCCKDSHPKGAILSFWKHSREITKGDQLQGQMQSLNDVLEATESSLRLVYLWWPVDQCPLSCHLTVPPPCLRHPHLYKGTGQLQKHLVTWRLPNGERIGFLRPFVVLRALRIGHKRMKGDL